MHNYIPAFYELKIHPECVDELSQYVRNNRDWQKVQQEHLGIVYHYAYMHRLPHNSNYERIIGEVFKSMNKDYWQYDLFGTYECLAVKYIQSGHYEWHCDYGISDNPLGDRKLSLSMQLSDPTEYEGCELEIVDWHKQHAIMNKEKGNIMIFDSRAPHKVSPLIQGTRYAIVAWAHGPKLR